MFYPDIKLAVYMQINFIKYSVFHALITYDSGRKKSSEWYRNWTKCEKIVGRNFRRSVKLIRKK